MDEIVQNTDLQDTTPEYNQEETTNIDTTEEISVIPDKEKSVEVNVMRDAEKDTAQNSVSECSKETEPFISVQYNHKNRNFTKEEAINFIQKGMHTEVLRSKLEYIATLQGTDLNSLVDKIVSAPEETYRKHLENLYGKDSGDVEIGMRIYREKQSETYKKIIADRENSIADKQLEERISVNSRLADEYIALKREMPDVPDYTALPDSVILEAAEGKRDLYSAYLCHLHKEKKKIDAAKQTEEAALNASTKSMKSASEENISSVERNFLSGLWGK